MSSNQISQNGGGNSNGSFFKSISRTGTLHKNDLKSQELIDEISDLREVLKKSTIGPLSREIIGIYNEDQNHNNTVNVDIPTSNGNIMDDSTINQMINETSLSNDGVINIEKDKLLSLIQDLQKLKKNNKDQESELTQTKEMIELKKKKIQILKQSKQQPQSKQHVNNSSNSNGQSPLRNQTVINNNNTNTTPKPQLKVNGFQSTPNLSFIQNSPLNLGQNHISSGSATSSPVLNKKEQLNNLAQNLHLNINNNSTEEEINQKISEVLYMAKYRLERIQFKNRVLLTSNLHNLSSEIHQILEKRVTKKQVTQELKENAKIVGDCEAVSTTILNFLQDLMNQKLIIDEAIELFKKKKKLKSKEIKQLEELYIKKRRIESAISFLNIEKRSVRELRDRFVSVCNEVTSLYETVNTIERDLSKWDIELERIYLQIKEGYYSDYFKLHPVFQSCSKRIKDHSQARLDLVRELSRREAARIASEIYISGIVQILECGHDLITDERMVDVARVRGLEHQVHMLYHALHDKQSQMFLQTLSNQTNTNVNVTQQSQNNGSINRNNSNNNNGSLEKKNNSSQHQYSPKPIHNILNQHNGSNNNLTTLTSITSLTSTVSSNITNVTNSHIVDDNHQHVENNVNTPQPQHVSNDELNKKLTNGANIGNGKETLSGSLVMELMIRNYELLFPSSNSQIKSTLKSPILMKTSSYLENIADLSADVLIESAHIAKDDGGNKFSDSLRVNGSTMKPEQVDVYMTSELLKHFFHSVDPFLTKQLFNDWLKAEGINDEVERMNAVQDLISKLSEENKLIIGALLRLLSKVASRSLISQPNQNPIPQLARAFSALILKVPQNTNISINNNTTKNNSNIEILI